MAFGTFKSGTNVTDKKNIKSYHKQGWPVDRISSHLGINPEHVAAVISPQEEPAPVDPGPEKEIGDLYINQGLDAEEIAEKLSVDQELVDEVIASIDNTDD